MQKNDPALDAVLDRPMTRLKIISWNLLHRSGAVAEDICELIEDEKPDLFLMQEATTAIESLPDRRCSAVRVSIQVRSAHSVV